MPMRAQTCTCVVTLTDLTFARRSQTRTANCCAAKSATCAST